MTGDARPRIVVLISGAGTNLQALIEACRNGSLPAEIVLVVSNRAAAGGVARAQRAGIPTHVAPRRRWLPDDPDRRAYDQSLADEIAGVTPNLLIFAGWMHILSDLFLDRFRGRMLNIHPSLLPAFPGRTPVADALAYGVRVTGVTVHFVEPGHFDTGPIVLQEGVPVLATDTEETLLDRLHAVEHRLLPQAAGLYLSDRLVCEGRRVRIVGT